MRKYKARDGFVWEKIGDRVVILDHVGGRTWKLNRSAAVIWESLVSGPKTLEELVRVVRKNFEIGKGEGVKVEIGGVVEMLKRNGLLGEKD